MVKGTRPPSRKGQKVHGGLGKHFTSPEKRRTAKKKTREIQSFATSERLAALKDQLAALEREEEARRTREETRRVAEDEAKNQSEFQSTGVDSMDVEDRFEGDEDMQGEPPDTQEVQTSGDGRAAGRQGPRPEGETKRPNRLTPDEASEALFAKWNSLLPAMVEPYLKYIERSVGKDWVRCSNELTSRCENTSSCSERKYQVVALLFASYATLNITGCECRLLPCTLVSHGLFPTSPHTPRMAVSIELLDLFLAVSERSSDAVTALATALNNTYRRRGYVFVNTKGNRVKEPFRRGLGNAMRWFDCLRVQIERRIESVVAAKFGPSVQPLPSPTGPPPFSPSPYLQPAQRSASETTLGSGGGAELHPIGAEVPFVKSPLTGPKTEADFFLQARCPACFGGKSWGMSLTGGGDIHVATDLCFNHRHYRGVAQCPPFHQPEFILSKEEVDAVADRIEAARSRPVPRVGTVPDEAIDSCQESHEAGTGSTVKTSLEKFDIGGLAALVCRHEIPLFVANVDTPGEQQKYAVALIERLMSLLPPNATITTLYDVGCVLDRSSIKYDIFTEGTRDRIQFATSVMHSYVHQWSCQLHYNPRMKVGLGLSDGENVERLWSRLRKLIGVCRQSSLNRRNWLIDRTLHYMALDCRGNLGEWIRRKLDKGVGGQQVVAARSLKESGVTVQVAREQWEHQKETQMSVRAHAPARLKKELNRVLQLQNETSALGSTVSATATLLKKGLLPDSKASRESLKVLEDTLAQLNSQAHNFYVSLNVNQDFPMLKGVELDFVRKLLMLRELKASVQKRATSAFWEFDKLDQASGGRNMALGTKMHQHVRSAMSKKVKALEDIVKRYNADCEALVKLSKPTYKIPLPEPLPTNLSELKESTTLMESIWVDPLDENTHRWVRDPDVREAIRAVHKVERCVEERRRLGRESDGMLRWYGRRISAVLEALRDPANAPLNCLLYQEYEDLLALASEWQTPIADHQRFLVEAAQATIGNSQVPQFVWVSVTIGDTPTQHDEGNHAEWGDGSGEEEDVDEESPDVILLQDLADEQGADDNPEPEPNAHTIPHCALSEKCPHQVAIDSELVQALEHLCPAATPHPTAPRQLDRIALLDDSDYDRLLRTTGRLNDECINGLLALIHRTLLDSDCRHQASRCSILSTYDLLQIQHNSPERLWGLTRRSEYWKKDIWVLPIHRRGAHHWVLATILPYHRTVYLFDSFGDRKAWQQELPTIMKLIHQLIAQARAQNYTLAIETGEPWEALSFPSKPVQTNSYDCGVWIIACAAAVMRGYHIPPLDETEIPRLRVVLHSYLMSLPTCQ